MVVSSAKTKVFKIYVNLILSFKTTDFLPVLLYLIHNMACINAESALSMGMN